MISKFSVKKPYTVLVGVVLAIILGVVSFTRMTADLLPNINLPYVIVMTTYPGASPETVETVVTQPVESAMATVSNIENIMSVSNENYSMVVLEFSQTADMNAVSLEIRENLDQIKSFWDDSVGNPIIMKLNPDMMPIMITAVGREGMDNAQISEFTEDTIMPELESIEGVASVSAAGLLEESVNVIIRREKIEEINAKIYALIDEGFKEAEQPILDGKKELESGLAELAENKKQLEDNLSKMTAGMPQYAQLQASLKQLEATEQQLQENLAQLEEGEKQIAEAKAEAHAQADMSGVLTVDTVKGLLTAQNFSMPAGYVTEEGVDYLVRLGDKPSTVDEMKELPLLNLHMEGVPVITLEDVADVFYTDNSADIYANVNGSAGVMLILQKQTGYSTGEVSDKLADKYEKLMEQYDGLNLVTLMDQGIYIDLVKDSIFSSIIWGFGLAVLILILFLKDLRPTLVVAVSVPISLVTAVVCMYFSGVTLNIISLSGLALGIGMLVDNSIVVIENIYRLRGLGYSVKEAAMEGAKEVAGAITASTLTTVCVFLPIVFTEGITRQLFVDMGLTIGFSLMASLLIAMTVVPAMSSKILAKSGEQKEGKLFGGLVKVYDKVLKFSLKMKPLVLIVAVVLLVLSGVLAISNGTAFMSDMDSTQLTVNVQLPDDATLVETGEISDKVVEAIMTIDDVQNVGAMSSSSAMSMGGSDSTNKATIYVVTKEDKKKSNEEIAELIRQKTSGLEAEITVDTSSMDMSALGGSGISIQVRGRDLDELGRIGKEVAAIVAGVEGTTEVSDGMQKAEEELRIIVNRDKAVDYGLTVAQVFSEVYGKLASASTATTLVGADKDYGVYVLNGSDMELTRELLKELEVTGKGADGKEIKVALKDIAEFEAAESLTSINRTEQTRYITVSAAIADGYNIGLVSADVEEALKDYQVPAGYRLVFSGENEMIVEAMKQMLLMLLLAVVFMYLIMVAQFQSLKSPFIIMFTIPLAFTGGLFGLYLSGSEVSVIALIGFVMLSGIIVNNGIVLIDQINILRKRGRTLDDACAEAAGNRLRPILMSTLTTVFSLIPMAFFPGEGSESMQPIGLTIFGGMTFGSLMTLFLMPLIYNLFNRGDEKRRIAELALIEAENAKKF